jgi:CubicO group peptidase (beta-lactamase class C family)
MRRTPFLSILSAFALFVLTGCTHVAPDRERFARLDATLETQARGLALPGVSAALMVRGELVWTGVRGWANIGTRTPVTTETPFNIASLTKPMTAVMLMQLVESGQLSLSTPMQRYDRSYTDARVTVGHVLSMSSQGDPPGQAFRYDGNIFGRLGGVVTAATGESLAQAFSSRVIEPLGLTRTSPGAIAADEHGLSAERIARYRDVNRRLAVPYNMYGGVEPVATIPPDPQPDASANVVSTASDYARFADAVMRGRLLSPAIVDAMWTAPVTSRGERLRYAYGWYVGEYGGHRLVYHYGYYPNAYSALALIVPERELVFVALSNGHGLHAGNGIDPVEGHVLACAVLREFVDPALPCAQASQANATRWRAEMPPAHPEIVSDPARLPLYAGVYNLFGGEARILLEQGRLWWHSAAGRYVLTQIGPDRFVMKADNRILAFVLDDNGNVAQINVTYPGNPNSWALPRIR